MIWTPAEIQLLGTMPDSHVAAKVGRDSKTVEWKRTSLGIPAFRSRDRVWSKAELKLLGTMPDAAVAAQLGISRRCVLKTRERLGIAPFSPANTPKFLRKKLAMRRHRVSQ
jgi:hypothetical protein